MTSLLRRAVFYPPRERRSTLPGPWDGSALQIPPPGTSAQYSTAGMSVDDESAMGIVALFRGVQLLSDAIATTPLRAVTVNPDGTRKPVMPSPAVITDPFMAFNLQEGLSQIVTSLILRGNSYLLAVDWSVDTLKPSVMRILHPDQVQVEWDANGFRQYRIGGQLVPPGMMIHLTGAMLANQLVGCSIIEYCRNALGIGMALEDVAGQFFNNGVMSTGIISVDTPLTDDQSRQTADMFTSRHAGVRNGFAPVVLGGGAKYTPISLTLEDAQFLESRQFSQSQIATLLGIPPHLLGIVDRTTSWGTGIEVQGRAFVDYSLRQFFIRLQNMFTALLPDGVLADFVTDAITRADTATRYTNYALALGSNNGVGWMCVDDVRALEGLPPLPNGEGQRFYVPLNSVATSAPQISTPTSTPKAINTPIPPTDPATGDNNGDSTN